MKFYYESRSEKVGRELRCGYRVYIIVGETEKKAIDAANTLMSKLEVVEEDRIRVRSLDSRSAGVRAQGQLRETADKDGFAEDHLWTGIGWARSGCGAALVGDRDQVLRKLCLAELDHGKLSVANFE